MNSLTILFLFISITLQAQNPDIPKYIGCDNPKGKKMKNLCNSSIQESILDYAADKIKNYGDRVP
ncbi:hypothetical protein [Faecalibacter bovis]|uniref:Uncharacterized protein n=1 Tax=Faecalibacter bovis TaxID=2898187 RepID=A0ABX7XB87_9FLAO|nr:hypothetical protein [Faecalibacter bovis]QTV05152.1 hypothetical protein J9309_10200 [Faecalibacter bovis]